jgi:hypothetical protein
MSFCDVTLIWQPMVIFGSAAGEVCARAQMGKKPTEITNPVTKVVRRPDMPVIL